MTTKYLLLVTRFVKQKRRGVDPTALCTKTEQTKTPGRVPSASAANERSRYRGTLLAAAAAGTAAQLELFLLE